MFNVWQKFNCKEASITVVDGKDNFNLALNVAFLFIYGEREKRKKSIMAKKVKENFFWHFCFSFTKKFNAKQTLLFRSLSLPTLMTGESNPVK